MNDSGLEQKFEELSVDMDVSKGREEKKDQVEDEIQEEYDDSLTLRQFSSTFDICEAESRPDMRNLVYKSPIDHLSCSICQQPFIKPLTTICGHTFCKECIEECIKMPQSGSTREEEGFCPLDRTPIDSSNSNDLFPTPLLISNMVDDLKVLCLNSERGCEWIGCRWEVEHHVLADCGYTGVSCNGIRRSEDGGKRVCNALVERRHISENSECVHRLYKCEFCDVKVTKVTEDDHLTTECFYNYQTCDMCMNDMIAMKNLQRHKDNCSKVGHLKCPASEIGCSWVGNNETSLEIHLQKNSCQLNSFLPFYKSLSEKVDKLSDENQFLQRQIQKILNSVIQGRVTNLGYNESIEEIKSFGSYEDQDRLVYLGFELDRLRYEMDQKVIPSIDRNSKNENDKLITSLINDNFMMKEDLNLQRMLVNSLRKQLQFLLFSRTQQRQPPIMGSVEDFVGENLEFSSRSNSEERLNLKL